MKITIRFGKVTASEIDVMLEASADSDVKIAREILDARISERDFELSIEQAEYLSQEMINDSDRVSQGVGDAAGRAFEEGGLRLMTAIKLAKAKNRSVSV